MDNSFIWGFVTIPAFLIMACLLWAAYSLANWAWSHLHTSLIQKIKLRENPYDSTRRRRAAEQLALALSSAPCFWSISGLGWVVTFTRDYKNADPEVQA